MFRSVSRSRSSNLSFRYRHVPRVSRLQFDSFFFFSFFSFFLSFASFRIDGNTLLAIFFFLLVRTLIKYLAGIDTESFYDPNNCTREHRHGPLELISFRSHFVNRPAFLLFFSSFYLCSCLILTPIDT